MLFHCLRSLSLLAAILAAASGAYAGDLKVASVIRFQNGDAYSSVRYYQGERVRMEWRDQATWKPGLVTYGQRRATIYQCDAQRVIELNLEAHKYSTAELNEQCRGKTAPPPEPKGIVDIYIECTDTGERRQILGRCNPAPGNSRLRRVARRKSSRRSITSSDRGIASSSVGASATAVAGFGASQFSPPIPKIALSISIRSV